MDAYILYNHMETVPFEMWGTEGEVKNQMYGGTIQ